MDKFSSKVHRVHMELGGKLLNSLRIETQFFERLQSVSVIDGAAHTQKDDVESNGGSSLENIAKVFVLFLCGAQLVLRYGVLTVLVLDLDKVDVTLRMLRSLDRCCLGKVDLLKAGGVAEVPPSLPHLPPATPKSPPPLIASLLLFCFCGDRWGQPVQHPDGWW